MDRARDLAVAAWSGRSALAHAGWFAPQTKRPPVDRLRRQSKSACRRSASTLVKTNSSCQSKNASNATLGVQDNIIPKSIACKVVISGTPSTLLLLGINRFGPPLVAREASRSAQRGIITSAYRGTQRPPQQTRRGRWWRGPGTGTKNTRGKPCALFISGAIGTGAGRLAGLQPARTQRQINQVPTKPFL